MKKGDQGFIDHQGGLYPLTKFSLKLRIAEFARGREKQSRAARDAKYSLAGALQLRQNGMLSPVAHVRAKQAVV